VIERFAIVQKDGQAHRALRARGHYAQHDDAQFRAARRRTSCATTRAQLDAWRAEWESAQDSSGDLGGLPSFGAYARSRAAQHFARRRSDPPGQKPFGPQAREEEVQDAIDDLDPLGAADDGDHDEDEEERRRNKLREVVPVAPNPVLRVARGHRGAR